MLNVTSILLDWYRANKRDLPWRDTSDPYLIWVSEIILQQTRVDQGLPYYLRFAAKYPTVKDLAAAPLEEVLKLWQGLGYYSRARLMHRAACDIAGRLDGVFPATAAGLREVPGIGPYTAAAVASFAFGEVVPVVDGNVCRVAARHEGISLPTDTSAGRKEVEAVVRRWIPASDPALFNQAIMDFGAMQCVPSSPDCGGCVLAASCVAFKAGLTAALPVKSHRTKVRDRYLNYLVIQSAGRYFLQQRRPGDIWEGLFEFPLIETPAAVTPDELAGHAVWRRWFADAAPEVSSGVKQYVHQLTHQRLHVQFVRVHVRRMPPVPDWIAVDAGRLEDYAVPRVIDRFLQDARLQDSF